MIIPAIVEKLPISPQKAAVQGYFGAGFVENSVYIVEIPDFRHLEHTMHNSYKNRNFTFRAVNEPSQVGKSAGRHHSQRQFLRS